MYIIYISIKSSNQINGETMGPQGAGKKGPKKAHFQAI